MNPEIKRKLVIAGQVRNRHTSGRAVGQGYRLAECAAVHVVGGAVLGVEGAVEARAVYVIAVEMLEAQSVGVICDQLVIRHVIPHVQSGDLSRCQIGAVAAVLELVVIDVGNVADVAVILVIRGVVGIIDGNEGRGVLDVYQIVFIRAVVDGDIIAAVVLVVIQIVLGIVVFLEGGIVVIIRCVVVVPGFEVRAVGVLVIGGAGDVVGGVVVQEVRKADVRLVVVRVVGGVMDSVEGLVIAVNDFDICCISTAIVVGDVAVLVLYATGGLSIVFLRPVNREEGIQSARKGPSSQRLRA